MPTTPEGREALDVIIVSYRCCDLLRVCLRSLREHAPRRPIRVWVVDNSSHDGTVELVREDFPEVVLNALDDNVGFAAASNLGIGQGDGGYVLVLNPDTSVGEGSLDRLIELMDSQPDVGIAGCRLVRADGSLDHAAKREFPTLLSALGHFTRIGRRAGARGRLAAYRAPEVESGKVDAVNGAFMLIRRRALEEVGLFDEEYWMYMEDLDLCYRFAQAGWVTWYDSGATVFHVKGGSSGKHRTARLNYAFHYGMLRFYRKHYAQHRSGLVNVLVYAGIAVKLSVSMPRAALLRRVERVGSALRGGSHGPRPTAAPQLPRAERAARRETPLHERSS
jgi:GT2 family glycosyltransferase